MPARVIPRPGTKTPNSPEAVEAWLRFLCLNTTGRGLAGSELVAAPELLSLRLLEVLSQGNSDQARAHALRQLLKQLYPPLTGRRGAVPDSHRAKLDLLGLSVDALQGRPRRRELAAKSLMMPVDTFRRRQHESNLLRDIAQDLWHLEEIAQGPQPRQRLTQTLAEMTPPNDALAG